MVVKTNKFKDFGFFEAKTKILTKPLLWSNNIEGLL
jgi:hypothetical protein